MSSFSEQSEALDKAVDERQQAIEEISQNSEFVMDLENLPKINHHWTQYGIRFVCQGANHPRHEFISR